MIERGGVHRLLVPVDRPRDARGVGIRRQDIARPAHARVVRTDDLVAELVIEVPGRRELGRNRVGVVLALADVAALLRVLLVVPGIQPHDRAELDVAADGVLLVPQVVHVEVVVEAGEVEDVGVHEGVGEEAQPHQPAASKGRRHRRQAGEPRSSQASQDRQGGVEGRQGRHPLFHRGITGLGGDVVLAAFLTVLTVRLGRRSGGAHRPASQLHVS